MVVTGICYNGAAMSAPRLLYVCFDAIPSPKGASTHVTHFVKALAKRFEVTLVSLRAADSCGEALFQGARHVRLGVNEANFLDRAVQFREAVWDLLEQERFDAVHFRTMWAALPVSEEKKRQGFRVVCEVNGVDSIELKYHYPAVRAAPSLLQKLRAQERLAFETSDALVTPSEVTKRYVVRNGGPEKSITVIPNGVDLELFQPASPAPAPNDAWTLLYVGALQPWQGLDFLLDAFRRAVARRPMRLRVLGAGAGRWTRALQRRADRWQIAEHVDWLPPVPHEQVPAAINAADACVAPLVPTERNLVQGCCPIKILEYMACGKPIVAANLPVVREILTDGEDALLYHVRKPARLADTLVRLADDRQLQRRIGEAALRTARERFGWQRAQGALLEVYEGLLGARKL
jgi:glycosyltransferase involved in cell wall biosynthesis